MLFESSTKGSRFCSRAMVFVFAMPFILAAPPAKSNEVDTNIVCKIGNPSAGIENSLSYNKYSCDLHDNYTNGNGQAAFCLIVDGSGTGHMQSREGIKALRSSDKKYSDLVDGELIKDWKSRTCTNSTNHSRTPLSSAEAIKLWGTPRKHTVYTKTFYTFDAHGIFDGEENIYHLDLSFDKSENLDGYRIRGIGIKNAVWVTASTQSHSKK